MICIIKETDTHFRMYMRMYKETSIFPKIKKETYNPLIKEEINVFKSNSVYEDGAVGYFKRFRDTAHSGHNGIKYRVIPATDNSIDKIPSVEMFNFYFENIPYI